MVTVGEAYRVINNFENSTNKLPYFSDKQNFHTGNNYIIYEDQQIHWLEWLKTKDEDSDFKDVYNHIRCAPMLCYLADSLNFITYPVVNEIRAMKGVNNKNASQEAGTFRKKITYDMIKVPLIKLVKWLS